MGRDDRVRDDRRLRVLVVGSGIAGLTTALAAAANGHDVTVATKSTLDDTATAHAQGGIAAVLRAGAGDSVESHVRDTIAAGAGLGDREAIEVLCESADARIRDLIAFGARFDLASGADTGTTAGGGASRELARGLEAAHSHARILHAFGDGTGREIQRALSEAVRAAASRGELRLLERTFLADLALADSALADRPFAPTRVVGAWLLGPADAHPQFFAADAVVLATGGAGQLFAHTSNPEVATGDGIAAAARAGAKIADLEFVQFHPTVLAGSGGALISEAVRGEGAVLLNERGERFLLGVHPDAELAPRDVVARGIADEMRRQGGRPVRLDARHLGRAFLETRFPSITARIDEAGLDWGRDTVPVTPAAHYLMGGVVTDLSGRTSIPGLYAAGETARTGVHGANRLASNSLLEGAVFGRRVAEALSLSAVSSTTATPTQDTPVQNECNIGPDRALASRSGRNRTEDGHATAGDATASDAASPYSRAALQDLMWVHAGLHRSGRALEDAELTIAAWAAQATGATGAPITIAQREDQNLLLLAHLTVGAALARAESRGAHFRTDQAQQQHQHQHQHPEAFQASLHPAVQPAAQPAVQPPNPHQLPHPSLPQEAMAH